MIISMLVIRNFAFPFLRERKCWVFLEETLIFWLSIFFYRKWTSLWAHMSVGWLVGLLAGWLFVLSYFRAGNYTFMLQSEHLLLVSIFFFYFALTYANLFYCLCTFIEILEICSTRGRQYQKKLQSGIMSLVEFSFRALIKAQNIQHVE